MATQMQPVVMSVSCPTCAAPAGHKCRTKIGGRRLTLIKPHDLRIARYRHVAARIGGRRKPRQET